VQRYGRSFLLEVIEKPYNGEVGYVARDRVSDRLELRPWQPGDRYHPFGSGGEKKLKTLFQLARIPAWERRDWPVLLDRGSIVWTRRFGPAAAYAARPGTATLLEIRESEPL
jgi:tRNA(Ile)-lysidine synthase